MKKQLLKATNSSLFLREIIKTVKSIEVKYGVKLEAAVDLLFEAWQDNHWVYVMGNGG